MQPWDDDDADLWEIDENLIRAELSDAQRADHHARREAIMVRKGLATAHGGDRKSSGQVGRLKSCTAQTAEALGQSERVVRRDLARGKKIIPEVLAQVSGTDLDKGVILDRLAATPVAEQSHVLDVVRDERSRYKPAPLTDAEAVAKQVEALIAVTSTRCG